MANFLNPQIKGLEPGDEVKSWQHATQTFVANDYELVPKSSFLYHVFFQLNNDVATNGMENTLNQQEIGILVKNVSLPKFSVDIKPLNAYNRPHLVQTKIHYDAVSITFYDDSADRVRDFWADYYTYYYRNSDYGNAQDLAFMSSAHGEMTAPRQKKDWGYSIRRDPKGNNFPITPYLSAIKIYSLHNKKYSEYILVNPIIRSFQHGDHAANGTSDTLQHVMMIEYESVLYSSGVVGQTEPMGFGTTHYDTFPSPLVSGSGRSQNQILPGGGFDMNQFSDFSSSNINNFVSNAIGSVSIDAGLRITNGLLGVNIGATSASEAMQVMASISVGSNNPFGSVNVPVLGSVLASVGNSTFNSVAQVNLGNNGISGGVSTSIRTPIGDAQINIGSGGVSGGFSTSFATPVGVVSASASAGLPRVPSDISAQQLNWNSIPDTDPNAYIGSTNQPTPMPPDIPVENAVDSTIQYAGGQGIAGNEFV